MGALPLFRDKQAALIGGQTGCHYWEDKQVALVVTIRYDYPLLRHIRFPLLGDRQVALIRGNKQVALIILGTKMFLFLGDKQVVLNGEQIGSPN